MLPCFLINLAFSTSYTMTPSGSLANIDLSKILSSLSYSRLPNMYLLLACVPIKSAYASGLDVSNACRLSYKILACNSSIFGVPNLFFVELIILSIVDE